MQIAAANPGVKPRVLIAADPAKDASGDSPEEHLAFIRLIGYFRETNAEALRLRAHLDASLTLSAAADAAAATHSFADCWLLLRKEIGQSRQRATLIDELKKTGPENCTRYARELIQVTNAWDDLDTLWPALANGSETLSSMVAAGHTSRDTLDALAFLCAVQTIPRELDEYLANYRIGRCLDFVATFSDQLPTAEKTRDVLRILAPQAGVVSGLIDLTNFRIIKADQRPSRQILSVLGIFAMAVAGLGLAYVAAHLGIWLSFDLTKWTLKPTEWLALNGSYVVVLVGVLGHWVLDRLKQQRSGSDITPFSEWLLWLHVNEVSIVTRIATVWLLVALAVAFHTFDLAKGVQPTTCFLAGYFIDSTFDALIGRFNTFVSSKDPARNKAAAKDPS